MPVQAVLRRSWSWIRTSDPEEYRRTGCSYRAWSKQIRLLYQRHQLHAGYQRHSRGESASRTRWTDLFGLQQVTAIECVGFFRSGETCILTYSPRTEYIHCGVRTTQERRNTAHEVQMVTFIIDILGVQRSFRNTFQGSIIKAS